MNDAAETPAVRVQPDCAPAVPAFSLRTPSCIP